MSEERKYEPGDVVIRQIGMITLHDGTEFKGIVLELPAGPSEEQEGYPWSVAWDGRPFRLIAKPNS